MGDTGQIIGRLRRALIVQDGAPSSDFDLNPMVAHNLVVFRPAEVLVPVIHRGKSLNVILTRRSPGMRHHAGQVAFPGGKVDAGDREPGFAALREAHEEIGLAPEQVELIGTLAAHRTVTGFQVLPFVGLVGEGFEAQPEPGEVAEVFEVPLEFLANRVNYQVHGRVWQGNERHYYAVPYGPHYIWGATARMLRSLAMRWDENDQD